MPNIYDKPEYYDLAFDFVNAAKQVDSLEQIIATFSKRRVVRVLDVCCGPGRQLREFAQRGYEAVGLDLNPHMLGYLRRMAKEQGVETETVRANFVSFTLPKKADFGFIMLGSCDVRSNTEFLSHLTAMAKSLNRGALYFIQSWWMVDTSRKMAWSIRRNGTRVKATYEWRYDRPLAQIGTEIFRLDVNDEGKQRRLVNEQQLKFIYPQEFKTLVAMHGQFEFLGWWQGHRNGWHLDRPLEEADLSLTDILQHDNMVLLRRR